MVRRLFAALALCLFPSLAAAQSSCPTQGAQSWTNIPYPANYQSLQIPGGPGELRVAQEGTQLFQDTFDTGTLDTTSKWTTSTGGTGVAATNAVGATVLNGGTTANSFSLLVSKTTFSPTEPGYQFFTWRNNIESPVLTTAYRFWGVGTFPGSPTVAAPVTQGIGWEIGTSGKLAAVTWATGTRTQIADLSQATGNGKQPTDGAAHKYFIYFRGDQAFWAIDSPDYIVACFPTGASGPDVNTNQLGAVVVSNAGAAATLQVNAVVLADTARNQINITGTPNLAAGIIPQAAGSAVNNLVLAARPANLYQVSAVNETATAGFLVVLNATSAPADGAITPLDCAALPASGNATINVQAGPPHAYTTGITAVLTSGANCRTKTTGVITGFISGEVK